MVDLTEGFDDPAIGKATIIVAPPPGGFKGALDGLNCKEFRFMPQMLGRAWRKVNKPRLIWVRDRTFPRGRWVYDERSTDRIVNKCGHNEFAFYCKFIEELNRTNCHV